MVTVNTQAAPVAGVQVTVVVPMGKNDPETGEQVYEPQGTGKLATAPH